jgi:hypothetical protein
MTPWLISLSITAVLTASFAFRFGYRDRPGVLAAFAALIFTAESIAQRWLLPPGAIGIEVAWICFPLAAVFVGMSFLAAKMESHER